MGPLPCRGCGGPTGWVLPSPQGAPLPHWFLGSMLGLFGVLNGHGARVLSSPHTHPVPTSRPKTWNKGKPRHTPGSCEYPTKLSFCSGAVAPIWPQGRNWLAQGGGECGQSPLGVTGPVQAVLRAGLLPPLSPPPPTDDGGRRVQPSLLQAVPGGRGSELHSGQRRHLRVSAGGGSGGAVCGGPLRV